MRNFIVTIDGKQYEVGVEEVGATESTNVAPKAVATPTAAPKAPAQTAPVNGEKFTAPMPGMVKKLSVANGTKVKKGDVILVLEAMKMDNDLTSPCDGVITYKVTEGTNVDTGALLAVIG